LEEDKYYIVARDHYDELVELVLGLQIDREYVYLIKTFNVEQLLTAIITLFETNGQGVKLLLELIKQDVKIQPSGNEIFRADSPATKAVSKYFRIVGNLFLKHCLQSTIEYVINNPPNFDVDLNHLLNLEEEEKCKEFVRHCVETILQCTKEALPLWPKQMKEFLYKMAQIVNTAYPNSAEKALISFIFLRFYTPAIFAPENFGFAADNMSIKSRKGLTLVARFIQGIVNQQQLAVHSPHSDSFTSLMDTLKEYNQEYVSLLKELLDNMTRMDSTIITGNNGDLTELETVELPGSDNPKHLATILRYVVLGRDNIFSPALFKKLKEVAPTVVE